MDKKLEIYRSKKRREHFFSRLKDRILSMVAITRPDSSKKEEHILIPDVQPIEDGASESSEEDPSTSDIDYSTSEESDGAEKVVAAPVERRTRLTYFTYILYFCFWATCWMIAIELKFGMVFLLLSALFGIYFNTRTEPRRKHEMSAYSVFNENCESIDGTLKAEQFEREIRYGPASVR